MKISEFYEKRLSSKMKFEGRIINVREDTVELVNGKTAFREVVEHNGGVVVLAVDGDGYAYMVRQFRYPVGAELLEAPAGKLEKGEEPRSCAVRELKEETGLSASELVYFGSTLPSPGFSDERLHMFLALGLTQGEACPDEDEFLAVSRRKLGELIDMAVRGEIQDGKTVNILFMAREYLLKKEA